MRTEMPLLRRCCFCLPLRAGLLAVGYLKLAIASLILGYLLWIMYQLIAFSFIVEFTFNELAPFALILVMVTAEIVVHVIFVVGAHKKNVKLLKVYYIYSLTVLVLIVLISGVCTLLTVCGKVNHLDQYSSSCMGRDLAILFVFLCIQAYVLLLVKCEIAKLNENTSFKFLNIAAEVDRSNLKNGTLTKEKEAAYC